MKHYAQIVSSVILLPKICTWLTTVLLMYDVEILDNETMPMPLVFGLAYGSVLH
jgi:hypothetical protein